MFFQNYNPTFVFFRKRGCKVNQFPESATRSIIFPQLLTSGAENYFCRLENIRLTK
jgi:hypothetical protein